MVERLRAAGARLDGFVVQEMVAAGVEMLVGVVADPVFGPVVACGAGGVDGGAAAGRGRARHADHRRRCARAWSVRWRRSRCSTGSGARRRPTWPRSKTILLRVGALADAHPEIAEMDCNPVMVLPSGVKVVDVRVRIRTSPPTTPFASRSAAG